MSSNGILDFRVNGFDVFVTNIFIDDREVSGINLDSPSLSTDDTYHASNSSQFHQFPENDYSIRKALSGYFSLFH